MFENAQSGIVLLGLHVNRLTKEFVANFYWNFGRGYSQDCPISLETP